MVERILEVLQLKNLTQSQFADEIGVQRSNISHLMSGRNKPSLEFIQKIIKRFPDINPEYILSGAGTLKRRGTQTALEFADIPVPVEETPDEEQTEEIPVKKEKPLRIKNQRNGEPVKTVKSQAQNPVSQNVKKVERIVYFFSDKTFKEYIQGND